MFVQSLLDNMKEGVVACDAEGRLVLFNRIAREWHGCDPRSIPESQWSRSFHLMSGDGKRSLAPDEVPLSKAFSGIPVEDEQICIARPDAAKRFCLASATPLKDPSGTLLGAIATMRDVTEALATERSLEAHSVFHEYVLDLIPTALLLEDRDGTVRFANRSLASLARQNGKQALLGARIGSWHSSGQDDAKALEALGKVIDDGKRIDEELKVQLNGKTDRWFQVTKLPVPSPDGKETLQLTIANENTTSKRFEEHITKLNQSLEARVDKRTTALKKMNDALLAAKREADQASEAKSSFLAAMSHEIRTPMNGVLGLSELLLHEPMDSRLRQGIDDIRVSARRLLGILDDILDFSKIEAGKLELAPKRINLERLIEDTVIPLTGSAYEKSVDLYLEIDPKLCAPRKLDPTRVAQVLANLVGNACKFSKPDGNKQRGEVVVRAEATDAGVTLAIRDNGIGMKPAALESVFESFAQAESSTTRRFGGTGLGLAICRRLVEAMDGTIEVRSTPGKGSTFDVFLPATATGNANGLDDQMLTGTTCWIEPVLGQRYPKLAQQLAAVGADVTDANDPPTAKNLVMLQGTSAERLQSAGGTPATAAMVLLQRGFPHEVHQAGRSVVLTGTCLRRSDIASAVAAAAGQRPLPESEATGDLPTTKGRNQRLLVAEDDPINRKVIQRQLELLGYAATLVEDGEAALSAWRKEHYDLLLTDLHMPKLDGFGLVRIVRSEEQESSRKPILALTANALKGEQQRATSIGFDAYLTKPIEFEALAEALGDALGSTSSGAPLSRADPQQGNDDEATEDLAIFDDRVLESMVGNDAAIIDEFLEDYLSTAASLRTEFESAHEAADWALLGDLAHRLKSTSRSVGTLALGELCETLERACRSEQESLVHHTFQAFHGTLTESLNAIRER